jgi:glycosyltransferase involved in cell wall biosynthesis
MYKGKTIGVVVPVFNEERLIGRVIETMPNFVDKIIVVDDCSQDRTVQIVNRYQNEVDRRVLLIQHVVNQGVGGAIATGYKWCRDSKTDIAVVMAGDGQMAPDDLPSLLDPVVNGEVDFAKGNRLFTGEAWKLIPRWRYLGNSILSLLTKIASGYWHIADSQSGYTATSLKVLKTIDWDQMYKRYGQPNDLLVRLNIFNFRVKDIPVRPVYNIGEQSGIKLWKIIPTLSVLLIKLFLWRMFQKYVIRDFHPLIFFYALALLLLPTGLILGIWDLIHRIFIGAVSPTSALFDTFLIISGLQTLFFAMWFDMEYNKSLKS